MNGDDRTLDEIRAALVPLVAANAAFDGWGEAAIDTAADTSGTDSDVARLAFAGGAARMIDAWFAYIDTQMARACPPERLAAMKIRERIAALVEARLDLLAGNRESLRRALAILALPRNVAHGARLGWRAADAMWRLAGDTATDWNHYSKRAILGGVYAATISVLLDDESDGLAETRAFLRRRIDGIMRFEKAKAGFLARSSHRPSLTRFVGRLRYPAV